MIEKRKIKTKRNYVYTVNEINVMRRMNHPNIIKMYEVFDIENHVALIMESMNGGNLNKRIALAPYTEKEAFKVIHVILEALAYMHSLRLIHRDVKPTNIMFKNQFQQGKGPGGGLGGADLGDLEEVKLIDFGLCANMKDRSDESLMHDKSGTVGYLAPEIITKDSKTYFYDERIDVFSLGVVFYEM